MNPHSLGWRDCQPKWERRLRLLAYLAAGIGIGMTLYQVWRLV